MTHFHTIDFPYYLSTFQKKRSGRKISYVHFLPDTLEGEFENSIFLKGNCESAMYFLLQPDGAPGGGQSHVYRGFGGSWYST